MPPRPQRLVRRRPLAERIQSLLNPADLYLWLSEEIQTFDWDSKTFGTRFGLTASFLFLLARANAGARHGNGDDDVFGDGTGSGWMTVLVNFLVWTLIPTSFVNAFYTMTRSRHYRLFEANVENAGPSTPSAQRVRVDSSPASSSPLRFFQDILGSETAESRAYPDQTRDVWEVKVWDPYPATLQMFCFFSPGHVLVYLMFLPLTPLDPRPSVTVFKCLILQVILSAQLLLLQSRFTQQAKDTAIIQKEVLHEYDSKYVHPRLHPVVREVGTQVSIGELGNIEQESVGTGTPTALIRRGFQTHPNPNYSRHYDPDGGKLQQQVQTRNVMNPSLFTPSTKPRGTPEPSSAASYASRSAGPRQSLPSPSVRSFGAQVAAASSALPPPVSNPTPRASYGGNLGVFSHVNSPLKKATSMGEMNSAFSPRNSREMAALEQRDLAERMIRQSSPVKDSRRATMQFGGGQEHSPARLEAARATRWTQERFPSRRI
ncbi:hypothetical protein B0T26DRAFT_647086 [Lasiosphaeria miniovina]|uniref:Meiotically up-regulated gene 154 protein n=1 Tax=Lasiosphaeria miniovina TaxID=1954250 RepID=A0AA40ALW5_9PEZI|nr:uncharacterized protein B0T26DRAFT_647086 [Lasiosphaeria miniovina]KAK0718137.1 hypothetical protein B0T26DRAFT_647086 [Lasiosphaeria miniovina]